MAWEQSYPTIWEVSDDLWEIIKILLDEYDPPAATGRPRDDRRPILNAIIYRFRTGCQWNHLGSSGIAVNAPNILCHQCAKAS